MAGARIDYPVSDLIADGVRAMGARGVDWNVVFVGSCRWFHSGGIFAAVSDTTPQLIIEGMKVAKAAGAVTSFDPNFRAKLWTRLGDTAKAQTVLREIVHHIDVCWSAA